MSQLFTPVRARFGMAAATMCSTPNCERYCKTLDEISIDISSAIKISNEIEGMF